MSFELVNSNVVIAAQQFNPSVLSQLWLVDNHVIERDEFEPGSMFTEMIVQAATAEFIILITPQQLQLTPRGAEDQQQAIIVERLGRIVETLPHTPYHAVGLNFIWHLDSAESNCVFSRRHFFSEHSALYRAFDVENARFGGYLSRDVLGARLKLDVKPITVQTAQPHERMQFMFNFNLDVKGDPNPARSVVGLLARWHEAYEESVRIMNSVDGTNR